MGLLSWGSLSVGLHAMSHSCLGGPTRLWGCSHTCSFLESMKHVLCCSSPRLFLRNLYINLALRAPWGTQVIKGNPKAPKRKLIYSIFYIFIKEREICLWSVNRRQILLEEPRIQVCLLISHPARHSCSRWAAPLRTQQGPQVQCSRRSSTLPHLLLDELPTSRATLKPPPAISHLILAETPNAPAGPVTPSPQEQALPSSQRSFIPLQSNPE